MGTRRGEADEVAHAVRKGGAITRPTLDRLLVLLNEKTAYQSHIAVEVLTPTMLKTIDNEDDALETIRRLEGAPVKVQPAAPMTSADVPRTDNYDESGVPGYRPR
jgi:hypothetical protein